MNPLYVYEAQFMVWYGAVGVTLQKFIKLASSKNQNSRIFSIKNDVIR